MWVEDAARFPLGISSREARAKAPKKEARKRAPRVHGVAYFSGSSEAPRYRKLARPLAPDLVPMAGILAPSISASLLPSPFTPPAFGGARILSLADQEAIAALTMLAAPSELLAAPPAGAVHADADAMIVEDEEGSTLLQEDTSYQEGVVGS